MDHQETMAMQVNTQVLTEVLIETAAGQDRAAMAGASLGSEGEKPKSGLVRSKTFLEESPPKKVALLKLYLQFCFCVPSGL